MEKVPQKGLNRVDEGWYRNDNEVLVGTQKKTPRTTRRGRCSRQDVLVNRGQTNLSVLRARLNWYHPLPVVPREILRL